MSSGTYPVQLGRSPRVVAADRARISARETFLIGLAGAVALVAITAPFMSRYGWDRDELYFLSAAHHLALGYVDFPPLIAVVGWLVDKLAPGSLLALRMVSLAAGAATVILVAFIARELGGGRRAQWIAAHRLGADAIHPGLGKHISSHLAGRPRLDSVPLRRGAPAGPARTAPVAAARTDRRNRAGGQIHDRFPDPRLRRCADPGRRASPAGAVWPWLGLAIAVALLAPNLIWQAQHGWPSVHFFSSQNAKTASDTSRIAYLAEQLLFLGPTGVLAVPVSSGYGGAGCERWPSFRSSSRRIFLLERGRSYYPLPADALAVAAGRSRSTVGCAPAKSAALSPAGSRFKSAVIALAGPIVVPFYSTRQLVNSSIWKIGYFKDEIGWPEMTAQVERAWAGLPADRARRRRDPRPQLRRGLRAAVLRTRAATDSQRTPQLAVLAPPAPPAALPAHRRLRHPGARGPVQLVEPLARIDNRWHLDNEERGQLIAACTLKHPLGSDWTRLSPATGSEHLEIHRPINLIMVLANIFQPLIDIFGPVLVFSTASSAARGAGRSSR